MGVTLDVIGSFQQTYTTGATTTIAAATSTAGFIFTKRWAPGASSNLGYLLRTLTVRATVTTAFGAAQDVGYDVILARSYSASATNGTAITTAANDGKAQTGQNNSLFVTAGDIRTASASAITAGTQTLDSLPIAKGSFDASAIRVKLAPQFHDFTMFPLGGVLLAHNEGFVIRNTVLMGATGVVTWEFTPQWSEVVIHGS